MQTVNRHSAISNVNSSFGSIIDGV